MTAAVASRSSFLLDRIERRRDDGAPGIACFVGDVERAWHCWDAFELTQGRKALRIPFGVSVGAFVLAATRPDLGRDAVAYVAERAPRGSEAAHSSLEFVSGKERDALLATVLGSAPSRVARVLARVLDSAAEPFEGLSLDDALDAVAAFAASMPSPFVELGRDGLESAAAFVENHPWLRLAVASPSLDSWLEALPPTRHAALLRQGRIVVEPEPVLLPPPIPELASALRSALRRPTSDDEARSAAERTLFEILEAHDETRGEFELNGTIRARFGPRPAEVDLLARSLAIALEVDGYYHFRDADAYRRDRRKDALLQREGHLVVRVLATDIADRIDDVMDSVLAAVRHARGSLNG